MKSNLVHAEKYGKILEIRFRKHGIRIIPVVTGNILHRKGARLVFNQDTYMANNSDSCGNVDDSIESNPEILTILKSF